jgi:sialate O-acetylesterase
MLFHPCCFDAIVEAKANVTLPRIFGDNMVLQRNQQIPVWGWAKPGETIVVSFNKQKKTARADKSGDWKVNLSPEAAGGPYALTIKGVNAISFSNVLVGEVWICSGQSNMEWSLQAAANAEQEIAAADFAEIRSINIPKAISGTPEKDIKGGTGRYVILKLHATFPLWVIFLPGNYTKN